MAMARVQQFFIPLRLIAQEQQAFAVGIQPAQRVNAGWQAEFAQRSVRGAVGSELRNDAEGFVESEQHFPNSQLMFCTHLGPEAKVLPEGAHLLLGVSIKRLGKRTFSFIKI